MQPTLAAAEIQRNITQYLSTTFALADEHVREGLERFLNDSEHGIFRGPYLRIRTPFLPAADGWQRHLDWVPAGFTPYRHQAHAFERLSTKTGAAQPTLVTTGTGSGKTESFLLPVLDHCRRERAKGIAGVKAVVLYPMNALATDQAQRIDALLGQDGLEGVTAGLYIGDAPDTEGSAPRVETRRGEIRRNPPDILLTNYKMLDLLLQRPADLPLWRDSALTYVVVDEFHTYDGAQGTDVAMLLRRLAAVTGHSRPGAPLGAICPVATSATLGSGGAGAADTAELRRVAATVFGAEFPPEAVVAERRVTAEEFMGEIDYALPIPDPVMVANLPDPHGDPERMTAITEAFTDRRDLDPVELGRVLRHHILTEGVLGILGDGVGTLPEILDTLPRRGAYPWGHAMRSTPRLAAEALARYIALLSVARDPDVPDRPFVHIEAHLWVRSVSRVLRSVAQDRATFTWHGEAAPPIDGETTMSGVARGRLPAVYCRHCGRSGWSAISPESEPTALDANPERVYRAAISAQRQVRPLVWAGLAEARDRRANTPIHVLESAGSRIRPVDDADVAAAERGELNGAFVLADLRHTTEAFRAARNDRCPSCGADEGIRFLGAGLASLASVAVTELFTGGQLSRDGQSKTLLFNDSVQDAAHRAGFVANRSYTFSLRELLASGLPEDGGEAPLNDLIADTVRRAADPAVLACVVPPDLQSRADVDQVLAGEDPGSPRVWELIAERLAFSAVMELGLRSRQGRTLELTRTAAAEVRLEGWENSGGETHPLSADDIVDRARELLRESTRHSLDVDHLTRVTTGYLRGILERIRTRGGLSHHWLRRWVDVAGTRRYGTIWGDRPSGMPAFVDGQPPPRFLLSATKDRSEFDAVSGRATWYRDFTTRALGVDADTAAAFLPRLIELLHSVGVLAERATADGSTRVYGLTPGHIALRRLSAEQTVDAGVCCTVCNWRQTVHPDRLKEWVDLACPRYRCAGTLQPDADRRFGHDYYRRLYLEAEPFRVTAAEHTGQLTRAQRERVEHGFRQGSRHTDPNLLSCSPTLELGIDIGALSAVILGSLPNGPANYVQRAGRAGRASGNALLVTMVGRRARERYYLAEPRDMIAGRITPPGSYPSAVEILRRQYTAFLLDRAGRGALGDVPALPRRASALFGATGWVAGFAAAAIDHGPAAVEDFLALFDGPGSPTDRVAQDAVRAYAAGGVAERLAEAERAWQNRLADLRARVETLDAAMGGLLLDDPRQRERKRRLSAERSAVTRHIATIGRDSAHGMLVALGVLPNYTLTDSDATLEATLTWKERDADGETNYRSELREYQRPALRALTEFAPGNFFYVQGFRHQIDGMDLGSKARPAVHTWRVCPECGFVRTTDARANTAPCPRCHTPRIGDQGSVYEVAELTRVQARDARDDAMIRDDHDERRRTYYELRTIVDIAPENIEVGSWRHRSRSFGVEFTRDAVVRRLNLGELRMDRPADTPFAGDHVRPNPFHVCLECGGAAAGPPKAQQTLPASGYDSMPGYHRPWCRHRRGDTVEHQPVVLAHTLHTEALRILVPAATVQVQERGVTFKAAFLAGLAAYYGGNLDHIDTTIAVMPERDAATQRRYLVVYDTLPGGSGYLQPCSTEDGIRTILTLARDIVAGCACKDEDRAACHRCLLEHVTDSEFPHADRRLAEEMLSDLLAEWETENITDTSHISLWRQVESELEARFLARLTDWGENAEQGRTFRIGQRVNDRRMGELRVTSPDGTVIGWDVALQNTIEHSRPDVSFIRRDTGQQVAVFLDGYKYHASPDHNRVADDAAKRARLRAHGVVVFQLSWDDMDYWADPTNVPDAPVWQPYPYEARQMAQRYYQRSDEDPAELPRLMWTSAIDTLLAFLRDPDLERWRVRAQAVTLAVMATHPRQNTTAGPETLGHAVGALLRGEDVPKPRTGNLLLARGTVAAGLEPVIVSSKESKTVSAFVVLDDSDEAVARESTHKRAWLAWLYWGNLIQFLDGARGDAAQLARSEIDAFDPNLLVLAGGRGRSDSLARRPLTPDERQDIFGETLTPSKALQPASPPAPEPAASTPSGAPSVSTDDAAEGTAEAFEGAAAGAPDINPAWEQALELIDPEEPGLESLLRSLARRGAPPPEVGHELDQGLWQAEVAWPDHRIAVVLRDHTTERDHYRQAGWEARDTDSWNAGELAARLNVKGG